MALRALPRRMLRAARLDADLFEEVEAEPAALRQAVLVVSLACAAGALGQGLGPGGATPVRLAVEVLEPLILWLGGSAFSYMVGATFFRGPETETDFLEVLRTTGFAFAPGLLRGLAFAGPEALRLAIPIAADLWVLIAAIVAVRQALDFTTLRAVGTFGVGYGLLWLSLSGVLLLPI